MYGEQDVIAVHKRLIWLNLEGKEAQFSGGKELLLRYYRM